MITIRELQDQGACNGLPQSLFFAQRGKPRRVDGRHICLTACAVRTPCLEQQLAYEHGQRRSERAGIWGGTTPLERARMDRATKQ